MMRRFNKFVLSFLCVVPGLVLAGELPAKPGFDMQKVERGRYISQLGGCNDCHTAGYFMGEGKVPVQDWLMGDTMGWHGPWGTTYAPNLRQIVTAMTEEQWVAYARVLKTRPPMPWFNVNIMKEADLRALHAFISYLGPAGEPAPAYLPPGATPEGPYASFPEPPPAK